MGFIGGGVYAHRATRREGVVAAKAQSGQAWIGDPPGRRDRGAPEGRDPRRGGGDLYLGAQAVQGEFVDQGLALVSPAIDEAAVVPANHEQIEQQSALGRQQGGEAGLAGGQGLHILGDQSLKERAPVRSGEGNGGAVVQVGNEWVHAR